MTDDVELAPAVEVQTGKIDATVRVIHAYPPTRYRCAKGHEWESLMAYSAVTPDGRSKPICMACVYDLLPAVEVVG